MNRSIHVLVFSASTLCAMSACDPMVLSQPTEQQGTNSAAVGPRSPRGGLALLAGRLGGMGDADGVAAAARFWSPKDVVSDGAGNLYVADSNSTIRKIIVATGAVTTVAGQAQAPGGTDGTGSAASFFLPTGLAFDPAGYLYVTDDVNNTVRQIVLATGAVTTVAGTALAAGTTDDVGAAARFNNPTGIVSDGAGKLYVSDTNNHTIRQIDLATGAVTTLAGQAGKAAATNGIGAAAGFSRPGKIAFDPAGYLYIADGGNHTIRRIVLATGAVSTVAGHAGTFGSTDGTGSAATFHEPAAVTLDGAGNLYVTESAGNTIRNIVLDTHTVTTLAGSGAARQGCVDGVGSAARFNDPHGLVSDGAGNLYVADSGSEAIRKVVIASGEVSTFAGAAGGEGRADGISTVARFSAPVALVGDGAGALYVLDSLNNALRKVVAATGEVATLAKGFSRSVAITSDGADKLYVLSLNGVLEVAIATASVTTLAGNPDTSVGGSSNGAGAAASFNGPRGIASDGEGHLYVADTENHAIRKIVVATAEVTTLAGTVMTAGSADGAGSGALFDRPRAVVSDGAGALYILDGNGIRKIVIATAEVSTLSGTAGVSGESLTIDGGGNLYVSTGTTVLKVTAGAASISTLLGVANRHGVQLGELPAGLSDAVGMTMLGSDLAIVDRNENAVLLAHLGGSR